MIEQSSAREQSILFVNQTRAGLSGQGVVRLLVLGIRIVVVFEVTGPDSVADSLRHLRIVHKWSRGVFDCESLLSATTLVVFDIV